ncbi:V-type ATP synthase subunit E [Candidatus Peregrinibacteria bacterium]|nr:V-type ATP synthase subunit E [Candidatus Peregrinibacteria bacterium]
MALQDILKKIENEAKKKAVFIKQVADDEIKKIRGEAQAKADARRAEIEQKIEIQSAAVIEKSKILAMMEGRSQTLRQKREVIDQAYEEAETALNALSDHDYVALLGDMMKHVLKTAEKGSLIVPANRRKQTEDAIREAGADFEIKSETHDFKGGFVLMSGKVEINLSFSYLVQKIVRPATEVEIAKILFP